MGPLLNRRRFLQSVTGAALGAVATTRGWPAVPRFDGRPAFARPTPTPEQLAWQRDELALFLHFGVNTFTDREWGDGTESPSIFRPDRFDARQWASTAHQEGCRSLIATVKHY